MIICLQASSPACTELETIVMDWLAKAIGLPPVFYHSNKDTLGGGVIQVNRSIITPIVTCATRWRQLCFERRLLAALSVCLFICYLVSDHKVVINLT